MTEAKFSIPTRQKVDDLFSFRTPLGAGASAQIGTLQAPTATVREISGYGVASILAVADTTFTVTVEESCTPTGQFTRSHLFVSALDAFSGMQEVCDRIAPCGSFMRITVTNTGGPQTILEICALGTPHGITALVGGGAQGVQGFQGTQGAQGSVGSQGAQGFQGNIGPQGFQGSQGPQGFQGQQGVQGFQGNIGPQGFQGNQGPQGFQGQQGPQGFQGDIGPQGFQGLQGAQGFQGQQGPQGFQGQQGPQGFQGQQGPQGFQGQQGPQGFQGQQGPQGFQGAGTANVSEPLKFRADPATNPSLVFSNQIPTFELTNGATKGVVGDLETPRNIGLSVDPMLQFQFVVLTTGAASADVRMRLTVRNIAVGELTTKAADETLLQTVAVVNTANRVHLMTFTLSAALIAAGDRLSYHLERLGADGADTFTGTIGIMEWQRFDFMRS